MWTCLSKQAALDQLTQIGTSSHKVQELIQDYADKNLHVTLLENLELFY